MELAAEKIPEAKQAENKEVTRADVLAHIKAATMPVKDGRKCVDGRYESGEDSGRLARPGGDFGYVMALLAAARKKGISLSPQQAVDAVYNAVTKDGGRFFMHTDEHAEYSSPHTIGCGHIVQGMKNNDDVAQALAYISRRLAQNNRIYMAHLRGKHAEKAILKVMSTARTINSRGRNMFFVYDAARDRKFFQQLVDSLKITGLTFDDIWNASEQQTDATLRSLAAGKPVFAVNVDSEEPEVKIASHVPS